MKKRWTGIVVASANKSVKQQLRAWLDAEKPLAITEAVWSDLRIRLAPVSESYLRDLLRATGLPFDQPWAGIRQHTLEELEESLRGMLDVYRAAADAGDRERARYCRRQVIAAKDRAKFLARHKPEKDEMAQWMLVWLENPEVFPAWVEARKKARALSCSSQSDNPESPSPADDPSPE
jgi:hypothetical protein